MGVTEPQEESRAPAPETSPKRGRLPSGFSTVRDIITFVAGLGFVCNEVFISQTAEPAIVAVGVTMMGLPLVFGADERKRGGGGDSK